MNRTINNVITLKIISMLLTPFEETEAYKLGIIDNNGKNIVPTRKFTTSEQKDAYTLLERLVFNIKRLLNKLPGGESRLKNLISAYVLTKECYINNVNSVTETELLETYNKLKNVTLVEETLLFEDAILPATNTSNVSVAEKPLGTIVKRYKKKITLK